MAIIGNKASYLPVQDIITALGTANQGVVQFAFKSEKLDLQWVGTAWLITDTLVVTPGYIIAPGSEFYCRFDGKSDTLRAELVTDKPDEYEGTYSLLRLGKAIPGCVSVRAVY